MQMNSWSLPLRLSLIHIWFHNLDAETDRKRTEQSFFVPKEEIAANGYDLSINKYCLLYTSRCV